MASKFLPTSLVLSLFIAAFSLRAPLRAEDLLPPPPPGDDMNALPPPPGDTMPPPPGDTMPPPPGDTMPPPPGDTMPPPPGDTMPPPPGGTMPPPPGDTMPPPPGDTLPPPPGGEVMPPPPGGGAIAPPPADKLFPEEPKKEEAKKKKKGSKRSDSSYGTATQYSVARHDSLWRISGKVYGDPFSWPLVFIANRDLIKDPDLIQPDWDLKVNRGASTDEIAQAVQKGKDTPRFSPHSAPRKKLPIDY